MTAQPNAELAYKILDHIDEHPEQWDQRSWVANCGTSFCFAGWALMLTDHVLRDYEVDGLRYMQLDASREVVSGDVSSAAARELGITHWAAEDLFGADSTREELGWIVEQTFGPRPSGAVVTCSRCSTPFNPADPAFDGHAQHGSTPWCRRCVDRCHEASEPDHTCAVCAAPGDAA